MVEPGNNLDEWMGEVVSEAGGDPAVLAIAPERTPYAVPGESRGLEASMYDPNTARSPTTSTTCASRRDCSIGWRRSASSGNVG